jgi:uncharacterized RmlC-like cupin family protein
MVHYERVTPARPNFQARAADEGHDHGAIYADVVVRRQADRRVTPGQTPEMTRDIGVSAEMTGSDAIFAAIVTTGPGARSTVHHHRECETAIYILEGRARFRYGENLTQSVEAGPGDFVYIPAHAVHTEDNLSETEPLRVLIARNCPGSVVVIMDDE